MSRMVFEHSPDLSGLPNPHLRGVAYVVVFFDGENRPLAAGMMRAVCWNQPWSQPRIDRKHFNDTWLFRKSLVMSLAIDFALVLESCTVQLAPLIRNPRISFSFLMSNRTLPFSSFFCELKSLPMMCPEISPVEGR